MIQLSFFKGKMAIIAIIVMFIIAGTAHAHVGAGLAPALAEPKTQLCRRCNVEKHECKARKQESKNQSKANKQLCKERCKENKQHSIINKTK